MKTTNPQKEAERGRTLKIDRLLGEKTSSLAQTKRPREVVRKWTRVSVMLGNP